jgi:hypothetical protein
MKLETFALIVSILAFVLAVATSMGFNCSTFGWMCF